jgi:hypothetical protein
MAGPSRNTLAALAWRRSRVRVSSGPLPFSFYLQVKTERKLQKPNTACGFAQQRSTHISANEAPTQATITGLYRRVCLRLGVRMPSALPAETSISTSAVHNHPPPQHVVSSRAARRPSGAIYAHLTWRSMHDPASGLRRILLPRTPVNRSGRCAISCGVASSRWVIRARNSRWTGNR